MSLHISTQPADRSTIVWPKQTVAGGTQLSGDNYGDLSTTQIYTQVTIEKLCEIHSATHPAKLEGRAALLEALENERAEDGDGEDRE